MNIVNNFDHILYEVRDRVATITLNHPERLNPISHRPGGLGEELLAALEHSDENPDVRCTIITGAGRAFSSGGDMAQTIPRVTLAEEFGFYTMLGNSHDRIRKTRKPTIAAVNGICYGAAFMAVVNFDFVIAADTARLGLIEARYGDVGADMLAFIVGAQWAKYLTLTGELITARTAKEIGLVLEVVPEDDLIARVNDFARRIAAMEPDSVMLNKQVINNAMNLMGWDLQRSYANSVNTLTAWNSKARAKEGDDGPRQARARGDWASFKRLRDDPFTPGWLDQ